MSSDDFCLFSNQITQALVSFETHENSLIDLILERSCYDPFVTGREYFWQFKNRITEDITKYRFSMYLEMLIFACPIRYELYKQVKTNEEFITFNLDLIEKTENISKFESKN